MLTLIYLILFLLSLGLIGYIFLDWLRKDRFLSDIELKQVNLILKLYDLRGRVDSINRY